MWVPPKVTMSANTIRTALGLLQDDPDNEQAWSDLRSALGVASVKTRGGERAPAADPELGKLVSSARRAHEMRREFDAVARLLEMEVVLAHGTAEEATLLAELARVLDEEVFDDARAVLAYEGYLKLVPGDAKAEDAIERSDARRAKWQSLVARYLEEAKAAGEGSFRSSLLVSAAETAYRYGRPSFEGDKAREPQLLALLEEIILRLKEAIEIDPKNRRASLLLERVYRSAERWQELAATLEQLATEAAAKEEKIAGWVRLARVMRKKLGSPERAAAAYERVIDLSPGHPEATSALVDFFTAREMWDHLVALYDEQLSTSRAQDAGTILQVAMVHWRMRSSPEAAEPFFERLRKVEPAHPGMLDFFRQWKDLHAASGRLMTILTEAQRAMPDGPERARIAAEIAKLAEEGANATKAIEQWRAILRSDPQNKDAREALKRLYRQTGGWNALADLLRSELEKVPAEDPWGRLPILREIAEVYREHIKSDSALVTVLSQIIALDRENADAVRELSRVYEALGRWRDLLTTQSRLAELEKDAGVKAELFRAIARRWLDQFSNAQNAIDAYESLHEALPADREAIDKLKELYGKRRAYKALYELLERETKILDGDKRREAWTEMAKLAAERLDRGADAMRLYKMVLAEDPRSTSALDALERQAERDKDWKTVAEVLEKRAEHVTDDASRLALLQKLGGVYADRLSDHEGAMRAWQRVLDLSPGHAKALRVLRDSHLAMGDYDGLEQLYAKFGDWEGLVDVLSGAADKAPDLDVKLGLSFRAAAIFEHKLNAPERAFRAYERVLSARPDDERAARALVPIYEKEEKWARLPALYEVLLGHGQGNGERENEAETLALYGKLAKVTGDHLGDRAAALGYVRKAYDLAPSQDGALEAFEAASRAAGDWQPLVEALVQRTQDKGDKGGKGGKGKKGKREDRRALKAKLADIYATELGKLDQAVETYRALVDDDDEDEGSVVALDKLLRGADRRDDLRALFDLRVARGGAEQKLELLQEWAILEEEVWAAPEKAIALYRRVLELVPEQGKALRALSRLLKSAGDAAGAAEFLEKDRDQRAGAERATREVELARLYMGELRRPVDALAAARRALEATPNDPEAVAVVEELLTVGETRALAAETLEGCYAASGQLGRQAAVLEVLVATAAAKADRIALYERLASVHQKLNANGAAFEVLARATREFPMELSLWDRLGVLANRTQRSQAFVDAIAQAVPPEGETGLPPAVEADLAERAATLYDEMLGEIDKATPYLDRILARDPSNDRAFARLKQILTTREKWAELEALYERAVQATPDAARRAELLSEVALVSEEITGDRAKAIGYYERILEIEPQHEQATRALDVLYGATDRWAKLAQLLTRRLGNATLDEALAIKLRLGGLYIDKLADPRTALGYLEDVLQADVNSRDARDLVEKCLLVPELRSRAATVLEQVYAQKDEARDLVRVLEVRLESAADPIERRELLRRVAELRDERLTDDPGAFEAYVRLVPLVPGDADTRDRLLEIARRLNQLERAAQVLEKAAEGADAPQPRAEILGAVARIWEEHLKDPARAETAYRRVLDLDPDDPALALPAARALERLYAGAGKSAELATILKIEVKLEEDRQTRRVLLARLGELCEATLEDPRAATEAWKSRLEDDPGDETALAALDRLYERTQEWRALVEVLRARERSAGDAAARKTFLLRTASTLAERLNDVPEAILAYRAAIDDFGPERGTLAALAKLYEVEGRWQDLADTLEADVALTEEPKDLLGLYARLGVVRLERLKDVAGAIEAHKQALAIDAKHAVSRNALEGLLTDADARREVSGILRPFYEAEKDHMRFLRVLEIETEYSPSVEEKLMTISLAANVAEGPLADPQRAFGYVSRALREAASEPTFRAWLERAERLAEMTGRWKDLVEILSGIAPEILEPDLQLDVLVEIAARAGEKLGDAEKARAYYVKALELRGDDRRALEALESLYGEAHDAPALLDVLKRRAEAAETDAEKKTILYKEARLCDETLQDRRAAIETYEDILDLAMETPALSALERLYAQAERFDDLVKLYERQLAAPGVTAARRAELHHLLGETYETRMRDMDRAFDEYDAALEGEGYEPTVKALERLMADKSHAAQSATMLEAVYLARLDWRNVMRSLEVRLASSEDPDERRGLLRRLVKLHEEQEESYSAALDVTAKLFAEDVTDETTWHELERLARVAGAEDRLADIFAGELEKLTADEPATAKLAKRAAELYEKHGKPARALVFYRRAHAFAPEEDQASFDAIDRLLKAGGRAADRVALYRSALDYREEPAARLSTLHTIAQIQETDLGEDDEAIETYRAALEVDETDPTSLESLARLYARRGRFRDLADLTRKRAEQSALPEDEAKFRLELGHILKDRLGEPTAAIDEYQAVVELVPPGKSGVGVEAVRSLEALLAAPEHKARIVELLRPIYEQTDDWRRLISVNDERLGLATQASDQVVILRETAKLWEERGKEAGKAFEATVRAFSLDPEDGEVRGELDRLGAVTRRWDHLAAAYENGITKLEGPGQKELLLALARLHDKRRDDPRRALEAYDRLLKLDESDEEPLEQMDLLATLLSDWPAQVRVLVRRAEISANDEDRAALWRRVGEAKRDMLEDSAGAIDAYERALELEPESAFTIDNLIALYEAKNDAPRLVDLYRRRVDLCGEDDGELKFELLALSADRYELGLGDRREAVRLLGEALVLKPGEPKVLRRLDELYTREKMWPELLQNLEQQSAAAASADKNRLQKRIGHLLVVELDDAAGALASFRQVLASGFDEEAFTAIRQIGESRDELRGEAADALEPVLRAASRWADVAAVLELRLRAQSEPEARGATLRALAAVCEDHLSEPKRALGALLRALAEEPTRAELHAQLERLAAQAGDGAWRAYADALGERAAAVFDVAITTDLFVRLGRISEEQLKDDARAAKAYAQAVEQAGDAPATLSALDRLYGRLGETRALADVLERRIGLETAAPVQADLYHRLAVLQIAEFGEKQQGLATLRSALEKSPEHAVSRAAIEGLLSDEDLFDDAFDALEMVYGALAKNEELASLYEKKVTRANNVRDRSRARLDLAVILEKKVGDAARARKVVEAQIAEDPSDGDALSELERLAAASSGWKEATAALSLALAASKDVPTGTRSELWMRVAGWQKAHLSDLRAAEESFGHALAGDPENAEILRAIEALQRAPGRERELVATLRARAQLEASMSEKRAVLEEAKRLAEDVVADPALAEAVLRDLLAEDDTNAWALEELGKLREAKGDFAEVVKLLLRRTELADDDAQQVALKHRAASICSSELRDAPRAIELFEEILEQAPGDEAAAARLRELYAGAGKEKALAKLLQHLVENAKTPAARSALRLDLAKLQNEQFKSPRDATDTLRAILDEEPTQEQAVLALSELYEKTGKDEELAELLDGQIAHAKGRGDSAAELTLTVRLAEVYEGRLNDTTRALETYEAVLARDAGHRGALEAVARLAEGRGAWARAGTALSELLAHASGEEGVAIALRLAAARGRLEDGPGVEAALRRALELDAKNADVRGRLRELYEKGKKWAELADVLVGDANLIAADHPEVAPPVPRTSERPSAPASVPPPPAATADVVRLLRRAAEIHVAQRKEPGDAVPLLERASGLVPQDREVLILLVDAYTAAKRERDAATVLERVIASYGNRRVKELSVYHHRLGKALALLGDKDTALAQLDMAFKIDPGSIAVLRDLGVLALEASDLERAQKTFKALLLQGQRLDANAGISKGEVFYYLGEISSKQGDKVRAAEMLKRALENEPSLERAKTLLAELKA